jgi:hypothetical protein
MGLTVSFVVTDKVEVKQNLKGVDRKFLTENDIQKLKTEN